MKSALERFEKKYIPEPNSGCWIWLGAIVPSAKYDYGSFWLPEFRINLAHRASYRMFKGAIPEGFVVDHLCCNTLCVNPNHLEVKTRLENLERSPMWKGNRTHCSNGHAFTPENTYRIKGNWRACRTCRKQWRRNFYVERGY